MSSYTLHTVSQILSCVDEMPVLGAVLLDQRRRRPSLFTEAQQAPQV